jgi:hypothetical protein
MNLCRFAIETGRSDKEIRTYEITTKVLTTALTWYDLVHEVCGVTSEYGYSVRNHVMLLMLQLLF